MDVHVPRAITRALRVKGVDVLTAQEDGTAELDDGPLLDRAGELLRVLFSRDEDFLIETDARQRRGEPFTGVNWSNLRSPVARRHRAVHRRPRIDRESLRTFRTRQSYLAPTLAVARYVTLSVRLVAL